MSTTVCCSVCGAIPTLVLDEGHEDLDRGRHRVWQCACGTGWERWDGGELSLLTIDAPTTEPPIFSHEWVRRADL